jgi:hypothetical protein
VVHLLGLPQLRRARVGRSEPKAETVNSKGSADMNVQSGTKGFVARPIEERFWDKVKKTEGCWFWLGAHDQRGYGQIWLDGRQRKATRVALMLVGRPLRPGEMACHHCDTPSCVRPDHLFAGNMSDNLADCVAKGRHSSMTKPDRQARGERHGSRLHPERLARGVRNGMARLTTRQVEEIRSRRGVETQESLAERFGCHRATIQNIQHGKTRLES